MKNAEKLKTAMRPGKVYRRQELAELAPAVDRDLKALVAAGAVRKLSGGLYYRPQKNAFGSAPPEDQDLVRAFLKTDDFLLTSYNHFNRLGLGLTIVRSSIEAQFRGSVAFDWRSEGLHCRFSIPAAQIAAASPA